MTAAFEIRLILSGPGAGWKYAATAAGKVIAANDGSEAFPAPAAALHACVLAVNAMTAPSERIGDGR